MKDPASLHGVTFDDGISAFSDPMAYAEFDAEHSDLSEERWKLVGVSQNLRIVAVVFTLRSHGYEEETTRIVTVRGATPKERTRYEVRFRHNG